MGDEVILHEAIDGAVPMEAGVSAKLGGQAATEANTVRKTATFPAQPTALPSMFRGNRKRTVRLSLSQSARVVFVGIASARESNARSDELQQIVHLKL